nr:hypothetical protein [Blunervirus sp.]
MEVPYAHIEESGQGYRVKNPTTISETTTGSRMRRRSRRCRDLLSDSDLDLQASSSAPSAGNRVSACAYTSDYLDQRASDAAVQVSPKDIKKYSRYLLKPHAFLPTPEPDSGPRLHRNHTRSVGTEMDHSMKLPVEWFDRNIRKSYEKAAKNTRSDISYLTSQSGVDADYRRTPTTLSRRDRGDQYRAETVSAFAGAFCALFDKYERKQDKYDARYRYRN